MKRLALPLVVFACGHAAPPKPPPKELPVASAADVKGKWVAEGELDWGYFLEIKDDGAMLLTIDRSKLGRCEANGTLLAAGERAFRLVYTRNECDANLANVRLEARVTSFTGDALTLVIGEETRTYTRAPE